MIFPALVTNIMNIVFRTRKIFDHLQDRRI